MKQLVTRVMSYCWGSPQRSGYQDGIHVRLTGKQAVTIVAATLLCSAVTAQAQACIAQQSSVPRKAQHYTNAQGQMAVRALDTGTINTGDELINTIAVSNRCTMPVADVVIDRPVPNHMTYVKGTAKGDGTDRLFSADGMNFGRWDSLRVKNEDGSSRSVVPSDIKFIRWMFKAPLQPAVATMLRYDLIQN